MRKLFRGCAIVVAALVVLAVIGSIMNGGKKPQTTAHVSTNAGAGTEPTVAATPAPVQAKIGEDVKVGDVRWKMIELKDEGNELKSDNQFIEAKKTSGKWVRLTFEVENQSNDSLNLTSVDLQDAKGRTFKPSSDGVMFIKDDQRCVFQQLSSNVARTCQVLYEVAADASGFKAVVGDLKPFGADDVQIDLEQ